MQAAELRICAGRTIAEEHVDGEAAALAVMPEQDPERPIVLAGLRNIWGADASEPHASVMRSA